jgi:hypothetical protein
MSLTFYHANTPFRKVLLGVAIKSLVGYIIIGLQPFILLSYKHVFHIVNIAASIYPHPP